MKIALRLLWTYMAFWLGLGTFYYVLTEEWVGSMVLWFLGVMPVIVAVWWGRHDATPAVRSSDDPHADPASSEGSSLGSFPTVTAWPVFLVLGVLVTGASLVYGLLVLPVGVSLIVWAIAGLARESQR